MKRGLPLGLGRCIRLGACALSPLIALGSMTTPMFGDILFPHCTPDYDVQSHDRSYGLGISGDADFAVGRVRVTLTGGHNQLPSIMPCIVPLEDYPDNCSGWCWWGEPTTCGVGQPCPIYFHRIRGFVWGPDDSLQLLTPIPTECDGVFTGWLPRLRDTGASDSSLDGEVVVGYTRAHYPLGPMEATRWTFNEVTQAYESELLGYLPSPFPEAPSPPAPCATNHKGYYSGAVAVSGDGEVVVGWSAWPGATSGTGLGNGNDVPDCCEFDPKSTTCSDQDCLDILCGIDPWCCEGEGGWDIGHCQDLAQGHCAICQDCCTAHSAAGCAADNCQDNGDGNGEGPSCACLVCDLRPFCCEVQWDEECALLAHDLCDQCDFDPEPDENAEAGEAFRWTAAHGMQDLGQLEPGPTMPMGISRDGTVIVGFSAGNAFAWVETQPDTKDDPAEGQMIALPHGDCQEPFCFGVALDASEDGSIIVGKVGNNAVIWRLVNGTYVLEEIEFSSNWTSTTATGVSADGSVVVGMGTYDDGQTSNLRRVFVRYEGSSLVYPLRDLVEKMEQLDREWLAGLDGPKISNDGTHVVGSGIAVGFGSSTPTAWRTPIPGDPSPDCPGDINGDGVVDGLDLLILLAEWGPCADPSDCPADLNGDGVVDGLDLLCLLSNWGSDCPNPTCGATAREIEHAEDCYEKFGDDIEKLLDCIDQFGSTSPGTNPAPDE